MLKVRLVYYSEVVNHVDPLLSRMEKVRGHHMRLPLSLQKRSPIYAADAPDLRECIATDTTLNETETLLREAIAFHIDELQADGPPVPPPKSQVE